MHVTSSSRVILSQDSLRMASVATRLLCDVASRVVSEFGDGGLFVAAFASRCAIEVLVVIHCDLSCHCCADW